MRLAFGVRRLAFGDWRWGEKGAGLYATRRGKRTDGTYRTYGTDMTDFL